VTYPPDELERGPVTLTGWQTRMRSAAGQMLGPRSGVVPLKPGWASPAVLVWAVGRAVNLMLLWAAFRASKFGNWTFGPDGRRATTFVDFLSGWDADRYGTIATSGYPAALPVDIHGMVERNNWAFLPVFPFLERVLSEVAGSPWQLAGVLISLIASGFATAALYALLRHVVAPRAAWFAVLLFSMGPLSFVFVLGYAESLFLLLIF
jgi:Gpi18-like mannosyltransferase